MFVEKERKGRKHQVTYVESDRKKKLPNNYKHPDMTGQATKKHPDMTG